jgi:hypothetical protein
MTTRLNVGAGNANTIFLEQVRKNDDSSGSKQVKVPSSQDWQPEGLGICGSLYKLKKSEELSRRIDLEAMMGITLQSVQCSRIKDYYETPKLNSRSVPCV